MEYSVKEIHFELSNKCNAYCPQCFRARTDTSKWSSTDQSISAFKEFYPVEFLKNLKSVLFCGNVSDPVASSDFLEIVEYMRSLNDKLKIRIATNGSLRSTSWWERLGSLGCVCTFGLDGSTQETLEMYRRNCNFDKIVKNAEAFISSGGKARWQFIIFKHNQHQLEEAKLMAEKLGFFDFKSFNSDRFSRSPTLTYEWKNEEYTLEIADGDYKYKYDNKGTIRETFLINVHDDKTSTSTDTILKQLETYEKENNIDIICKSYDNISKTKIDKMFYNSTGHIVPCCWHGATLSEFIYDNKPLPVDFTEIYNVIGIDNLDSTKYDFDHVYSHYIKLCELLEESWKTPHNTIKKCTFQCGVKI